MAIALLSYGLLGVWSQGDQQLALLRSLGPQIGLGLLLVLIGYSSLQPLAAVCRQTTPANSIGRQNLDGLLRIHRHAGEIW